MNKYDDAIKETERLLSLSDYSDLKKKNPEISTWTNEMIKQRLRAEISLIQFNNPKNWIQLLPKKTSGVD